MLIGAGSRGVAVCRFAGKLGQLLESRAPSAVSRQPSAVSRQPDEDASALFEKHPC
jgi:hypothetical protein